MSRLSSPRDQGGAVMVIGLIILTIITLLVTSAFTLSSTNIKTVGNIQFRDESLAAANKAIEIVIGTSFYTAPVASQVDIDINNDGTNDYVVMVAAPTCLRGSLVGTVSGAGYGSSKALGFTTPTSEYNTVWDIQATVTDARSGTSVMVHQGVRKRLTQTQLNAVCP